jgi:hypothetical protein
MFPHSPTMSGTKYSLHYIFDLTFHNELKDLFHYHWKRNVSFSDIYRSKISQTDVPHLRTIPDQAIRFQGTRTHLSYLFSLFSLFQQCNILSCTQTHYGAGTKNFHVPQYIRHTSLEYYHHGRHGFSSTLATSGAVSFFTTNANGFCGGLYGLRRGLSAIS